MLDFRHETFIILCRTGSYTKAAERLCITQPAVSQHIKFLENTYGGKLFDYRGRVLTLTERGERLRDYVMSLNADISRVRDILRSENFRARHIFFGATLSIGEYVMPDILAELLNDYPDIHMEMQVNNTEVLLRKLREGSINFALLEGFFDKSEYGWELFSEEKYIAVCGADSPLAGKPVQFSDIVQQRLILRESGSGTRFALEQILSQHNLTIRSFKSICEIGNMNAIKRLVSKNCGITFLYEAAVKNELRSGELKQVNIRDLRILREFNFVFLNSSIHQEEYLHWHEYFKRARTG